MVKIPTVRIKMPFGSPRGKSESGGAEADRDAEAEIFSNLWRHQLILPPMSFRRSIWDWVLITLVVFSCVQIPLVLAFKFPDEIVAGLEDFDLAIDIIFWIDIVLIFNTSYYIDEELIANRKAIVKHYLFGWFFADFAATFPWDVFSGEVQFLRLIRLLRLTRVMKKMDTLKGGMGLRFFYLMFWWMLIAHWIACFWWWIGSLGFRVESEAHHEGKDPSNETSWLVRIPPVGRADQGFSAKLFNTCVDVCLETTNYSRMQCMSNNTCDDNNMNPDDDGAVFTAWLSAFYWAFTMLMKTPFVGPDTALEKAFSCVAVIVGAIIFALLLGQITTMLLSMVKAGATLRDTLVTFGTFAANRRLSAKIHNTIKDYIQSEARFTKGMDTVDILEQFPVQIKGDVLTMIHSDFLGSNPSFLRCSEQLKRQILSILKPAIALKKSTVLAGNFYGCTLYVLLKGTLQVSQAPSLEVDKPDEKSAGKTPSKMSKMSKMGGTKNAKGFKDKLKVRMLEKPGSLIPYAETIGPKKPSVFSIFAVTRCKMLTFEASDMMSVLKSYPSSDSNLVVEAIKKDFVNLVETLKMKDSLRESKVGPESPGKDSSKNGVADHVSKMEEHADKLTKQIEILQQRTMLLPKVLHALHQQLGIAPSARGASSDAPVIGGTSTGAQGL